MFGLYRIDLLSTKLLSLSLSPFIVNILPFSFQSLFAFSSSPNYSAFITLFFLRHSFPKLLKFTPFLCCASIPSTFPLINVEIRRISFHSDFLPASVNFFCTSLLFRLLLHIFAFLFSFSRDIIFLMMTSTSCFPVFYYFSFKLIPSFSFFFLFFSLSTPLLLLDPIYLRYRPLPFPIVIPSHFHRLAI